MDNFSDRLTLEGAGGQTDDTRSTFRPPLGGITSKLWVHVPDTSFWGYRQGNQWKMELFCKSLRT